MSNQRLSWQRTLAACLCCLTAHASPTWAGEPALVLFIAFEGPVDVQTAAQKP